MGLAVAMVAAATATAGATAPAEGPTTAWSDAADGTSPSLATQPSASSSTTPTPPPSPAPPAGAPTEGPSPPLGLQVDPLVVPPTAPPGASGAVELAVPDAVAAGPAPSITLPFGTPATVAVAPFAGSPAAAASRDCGFSIPLRDGLELWIFCDTTDGQWINGTFESTWFENSTAALTWPDQPLVLHDRFDDAGQPVPFISPIPAYQPCWPGLRHVIWPISGTAVPDGGIDRVWVWYENICQDPLTLQGWSMSVGVAGWAHTLGNQRPLDQPIQATVLDADLFPMGAEPFRLWGTGAVYDADGFVYLYRCASNGSGCQIARVPASQGHLADLYRYYDGDSWELTPPAGGTVALPPGHFSPLGAHHVLWLPAMGVFAMASAAGGAGASAVALSVAARPEGPWSDPAIIPMSGCMEGIRCYHGALHGQGSGIDHVAVTIFDAAHTYPNGRVGGMTRWAQVRVDLEPPPPGVCRSGFRDVWSAHRFCPEIRWAHLTGVAGGYPDYSFRPAATVTRQAAIALLWRVAGSPAGPFPDPGFADVGADHPFRTAIAWSVQAGVATGYPDGRFHPGAPVTRQAMAAFLWRSEGRPDAPPPSFPDVSATHPFEEPIGWMVSTGLTGGYDDGTFRPGAPVSRQAAVAFLHRLAT